MSESRTLNSSIGSVRIVTAGDPGSAKTAVIVLHQAGGLGSQVEQSVDRFAASGAFAVGPDLFHRKDLGPDFNPMEQFGGDLEAFSAWLEGSDALLETLTAILDYLEGLGFHRSNIGVVGYSYGGWTAFLAAVSFRLGAAVTWYGNGIGAKSFGTNEGLPGLLDRVADLQTPWLGLYGELDFLLAPGELDALSAALSQADVDADIVSYETVGHAFDEAAPPMPGAPAYDEAIVQDARAREAAWLSAHVVPRD